jgi:tRNA pseudouridine38-40 synthase
MRLALEIEYDGTDFNGWQSQPHGRTVQDEIEHALKTIFGTKISILGSSRTDTGVHARHQVAHFDMVQTDIPLWRLVKSVNGLTGKDVVVKNCRAVADNFHARYAATGRRYRYYFAQTPMALKRNYTWFHPLKMRNDLTAFCAEITRQSDFKAFCKSGVDVEHYRCQIDYARMFSESDIQIFEIKSNRFLYGMVRALAGLLVKYDQGDADLHDVQRIFASRDRTKAPMAVPAHGLVLEEVYY